jgi:putative flavoprotein involved in K+ transport
MPHIDVVVIGAGQAGLAVSRLLCASGVHHVVLDRGGVAERWAGHRWESLSLLSPNWLSRLPGYRYAGPDPEGFMTAGAVAAYLRSYAATFAAPVVAGADVLSVRASGGGYAVHSTAGSWTARAVVVATGWCDRPVVPGFAAALDRRIEQLTAATFRHPGALPDGRVLVVGASATGSQLADELARAGREVVLAVGSHTRMPRRHRGRDIMWWLDAMGLFDRRFDQHPPSTGVRAEPSMQLVGSADGRDVDLRSLQDRGVELVGRLVGLDRRQARFADDLSGSAVGADLRLRGLLDRIDTYARAAGHFADGEPGPPVKAAWTAGASSRLDLYHSGVRTVIWATGYRRAYPWLHLPVLDRHGDIAHVDGATPAPGLQVVGMRWQSRRGSSFLDGVRHDAATVVGRVVARLRAGAPRDDVTA